MSDDDFPMLLQQVRENHKAQMKSYFLPFFVFTAWL